MKGADMRVGIASSYREIVVQVSQPAADGTSPRTRYAMVDGRQSLQHYRDYDRHAAR